MVQTFSCYKGCIQVSAACQMKNIFLVFLCTVNGFHGIYLLILFLTLLFCDRHMIQNDISYKNVQAFLVPYWSLTGPLLVPYYWSLTGPLLVPYWNWVQCPSDIQIFKKWFLYAEKIIMVAISGLLACVCPSFHPSVTKIAKALLFCVNNN